LRIKSPDAAAGCETTFFIGRDLDCANRCDTPFSRNFSAPTGTAITPRTVESPPQEIAAKLLEIVLQQFQTVFTVSLLGPILRAV